MPGGSKLSASTQNSDSLPQTSPSPVRICSICKKKVISPITCHFCRHFYHPNCTQITKAADSDGRLRSKCASCSATDATGQGGPRSNIGSRSRLTDQAVATPPTLETLLAAIEASSKSHNKNIAEMRTDINAKFGGLLTRVQGLEASSKSQADQGLKFKAAVDELAALPGQMRDLSEKVEGLTVSTSGLVADLAAKVETLSGENRLLASKLEEVRSAHAAEVADLKSRVGSLERSALSCDLIITAVPELEGEDLSAIFRSIAARLAVNFSPADLVELVRLKSTVVTNKPRLILARLASVQCRNRFLAAKRAKGSVYADELGLPIELPHTPIFVNEHLPPLQSKFLGKVRSYAKARGFRFIWMVKDCVHVKRDASSNPIIIKSEADLHLLTSLP